MLRGQPDFGGRREAVAAELTARGVAARLVQLDEVELDARTLLWMEGSTIWYRKLFDRLRALPAARRPPVLFWHVEPLPLPHAAPMPRPRLHAREVAKILLRDERTADPYSNLRSLRRVMRAGLVTHLLVSSAGAQELLADHGIRADFMPMALPPGNGRDLGLERDIDVLFLGAGDVPRRKRIIGQLRRVGVPVVELGGWGKDNIAGDERIRLLNRTKILLNFPRQPGLLSGFRMVLGMANKALLVAEPIYRPEPYRAGEHFVMSPLDELPAVVESLLADDERRAAIADAGHRFVVEEMTLARRLDQILPLVT